MSVKADDVECRQRDPVPLTLTGRHLHPKWKLSRVDPNPTHAARSVSVFAAGGKGSTRAKACAATHSL